MKAINKKIIDINCLKNNKNICIGFDIKNGFIYHYELFNDYTFITDKFSIFNEASLLKNENNHNAVDKIKNLMKNKSEKIDNIIFNYLKNIIKNKNQNK